MKKDIEKITNDLKNALKTIQENRTELGKITDLATILGFEILLTSSLSISKTIAEDVSVYNAKMN